ncbi:MAG: FecR domain-containing protein [Cyclobacteriaceae bacterium]
MYRNYQADDLIKAPGFVAWVKQEDRESEIFWTDWLLKNKEKKSEVEKARAMILSMGVEESLPSKKQVEKLWKDIDANITSEKKQHYLGTGSSFFKMAAAAVVAGILVAFAMLMFNTEDNTKEASIALINKTCPAGQKSTITLTDGTRVKLNANSKLTFPETFSDGSREVILEGEAFFEVARDPSKPFVITSGDLKTTVLGTSFNIKAYPELNDIKVAVITGKVAVESNSTNQAQSKVTLLPNEMALYSKLSKELSMGSYTSLEELAWKDGVLIFKNQSINEIATELAKWYGVTFVFDKKLNFDKDYTGSFDNKSLEEVLTGIGFVFDFEFEIDNKVVTLN